MAILRTRTPPIQVQTLPLEGPRILRVYIYNIYIYIYIFICLNIDVGHDAIMFLLSTLCGDYTLYAAKSPNIPGT